jgi:serine protease Do
MEENMHDKEENSIIKEIRKRKKSAKNRIVRKTLVSIILAIVFGTIACFTFLVLQPIFTNWLYPKDIEQEIVILPAEVNEVSPEDMLQEETGTIIENLPQIQSVDMTEEDLLEMYDSIRSVATETMKSVVTVSGVTSDMDWFDNSFESEGVASGVIVAESSKEMLILVESEVILDVEQIFVTFSNGTQIEAILKEKNENVGFAVVAVLLEEIDEATKDIIKVATWGSSNSLDLEGTPIIALGSPDGHTGSICYGMITSAGVLLERTDSNYHLMKTDIYGSKYATGILINYKGQVIGMIHQEEATSEMQNSLVAIGISDLRTITETMSNGKKSPMLGVLGIDVTEEAHRELGVPFGAFVTEVVLDSPAMNAGIQSGDVIVDVDAQLITYYSDFTKALYAHEPEEDVVLSVMRQNGSEYNDINIIVHLGTME